LGVDVKFVLTLSLALLVALSAASAPASAGERKKQREFVQRQHMLLSLHKTSLNLTLLKIRALQMRQQRPGLKF
jgi:hypothetical protein